MPEKLSGRRCNHFVKQYIPHLKYEIKSYVIIAQVTPDSVVASIKLNFNRLVYDHFSFSTGLLSFIDSISLIQLGLYRTISTAGRIHKNLGGRRDSRVRIRLSSMNLNFIFPESLCQFFLKLSKQLLFTSEFTVNLLDPTLNRTEKTKTGKTQESRIQKRIYLFYLL